MAFTDKDVAEIQEAFDAFSTKAQEWGATVSEMIRTNHDDAEADWVDWPQPGDYAVRIADGEIRRVKTEPHETQQGLMFLLEPPEGARERFPQWDFPERFWFARPLPNPVRRTK